MNLEVLSEGDIHEHNTLHLVKDGANEPSFESAAKVSDPCSPERPDALSQAATRQPYAELIDDRERVYLSVCGRRLHWLDYARLAAVDGPPEPGVTCAPSLTGLRVRWHQASTATTIALVDSSGAQATPTSRFLWPRPSWVAARRR